MGTEKTRYSVIETIVYIVYKEVILGPNQLSANHLGRKQ